jgi:DNA-binding GntR family transcriptional regulator
MIELREDRPVWRQVTEILRTRITEGTYRPGQRFPSEGDLIGEFDIGRSTARKVARHLREEGLIYTVPQIGSFVTRDDGAP